MEKITWTDRIKMKH